MKKYDPAEYMNEQHYRIPYVAGRMNIGESTARRLFAAHPRIRYLPQRDIRGRTRRTMLIPESVFREVYASMYPKR